MKQRLDHLRNIAIIAHVDHGKTTLVDALLRQTHVFRQNQEIQDCVLDSNDIERERGITIFSKNAAIHHEGVRINVIDTPGHADFGGEVERVLNMADGVLLLVDAFDGPMPQTRFVLRKALQADLRPLVVINKIDRPGARPHEVLDEVFELFLQLDAREEQLDFPVVYASGRQGMAKREMEDRSTGCRPLLDAIISEIPPPEADPDGPLQLQVAAIDYNDYVGRIAIGRVNRGVARDRMDVAVMLRDGSRRNARIETVQVFDGIGRKAAREVGAGDIALITGIPDIGIYDTIADPERPEALPIVHIDEPTLTMEFRANDSPFLGREGKYVTSRHLKERLERELRSNIALRMEQTPEGFLIGGRGLLHLGIVIETMRREGHEFAVGRPHVVFHEEDGVRMEPVEILTIDVPEESGGKVMELVGARRGAVERMEHRNGGLHLTFRIPSRGLIGLRSRLLTATRGEAVMHHVFWEYEPFKGEVPGRPNGVLVSASQGKSTAYALDALQLRGQFFIHPAIDVYEGMIVGENSRPDDLEVNVCREKKLTNVRASGAHDRNADLAPPREFSLEAALEYIEEDELLEVTPASLRMRKRVRTDAERRKLDRQARLAAKAAEKQPSG
ncbi:MAG: translational GTPase TypA [Planctomycetota bacterium]|jgi:GTP-binding protein|nr:translational GTPase TypA [Planctomycetota bacterium]